MNKKAIIMKMASPKGTEMLKYLLQTAKYIKSAAGGYAGKIETAYPYQVFQEEGHHLFCVDEYDGQSRILQSSIPGPDCIWERGLICIRD